MHTKSVKLFCAASTLCVGDASPAAAVVSTASLSDCAGIEGGDSAASSLSRRFFAAGIAAEVDVRESDISFGERKRTSHERRIVLRKRLSH